MARPRKIDSELRVKQLKLHLTVEEKNKILHQAAASALHPSAWIRRKIFTGKFPSLKVSPIEVHLYQELKRIGVNLNQGTHKLNQGEFPAHYTELQLSLLKILNNIYKVLIDDRKAGER